MQDRRRQPEVNGLLLGLRSVFFIYVVIGIAVTFYMFVN